MMACLMVCFTGNVVYGDEKKPEPTPPGNAVSGVITQAGKTAGTAIEKVGESAARQTIELARSLIDDSSSKGDLDEAHSIVVRGSLSLMSKSYRQLLGGISAYRANRSLAPNSTLRFFVSAQTPGIGREPLIVSVIGTQNCSMDIPVDDQGYFISPIDPVCEKEDARIYINRTDRQYEWWARVMSYDLPDNAMRMGDLRLQYLVNRYIRFQVNALLAERRVGDRDPDYPKDYGWSVADKVDRAVITDGTWDESIPHEAIYTENNGIHYMHLPMHKRNWSNDALIRFFDASGRPASPRINWRERDEKVH
ncbi:hypothetical protein KSF73_03670 [Burkholderiaceae bacterium DAT-1]|nr:hypothetical protein [Burkholderiaceae bacterium DAT-1]